MTKRPVIGIPCTQSRDEWGGLALGNSETYLRAIEAAGGTPLLLPLSDESGVLEGLYEIIDGLLLAGGVDIHPDAYNHPPHENLGSNNLLQDRSELYLTRRAIADGKPILGICRGHQMLNVAAGGTLYQDIPAEIPGALNHEFSADAKDGSVLAHDIQIDEESWLAETLGQTIIKTNSMHHQSVRDVAPSMRIVGKSSDGVVEVIESTNEHFAVGIQSHPEELWNTSEPQWTRLFATYVQEVAKTVK
jgi:putative glutamine amidotransferase